ncbi:uncharacterized protein BJ212DRAFT_1206295, partial [Suillus subaureus]
GESETTMLYSFIKTSKLHHWLSQPDCLPAIQECKFLFDSTYAPKSAGTLGEELAEDPLDDSLQAPSSAVAGDWLSSPVPSSIQHIYATPTGELVFAVHKLLPHHNQSIDPFAMYPHFPTKMYLSSSSSHLENVKVSWVVSHFARWAVSSDTVVILSLSR